MAAWPVQGLPPVVLVPGLTGSSLEVRLTNVTMPHGFCSGDSRGQWQALWMRIVELLPLYKDCFQTKMAVFYDNTTDTYGNTPGVELRVADFGGVSGISVLDPDIPDTSQFSEIINILRLKLGYVVGKNLHGAPYDWRLDGYAHCRVGGFYAQLKGLIESTVQTNGQRAVLLSHSLGCPTLLFFFHHYVSEDWRRTHIHGWVAMSGPWVGSIVQANSYLSGWTFGLPPWLVPHDYAKWLEVTSPSGIWLTPQPAAFGDMEIIMTPSGNYTVSDLPDIVSIIGKAAGGDQTMDLFQRKWQALSQIQRPPTYVPIQNWYSNGVETPEGFMYDMDIVAGFNRPPRNIKMGKGDGVVNLMVLQQVETWPIEPTSPVVTRTFANTSHYGMFFKVEVQKAIVEYLSESTTEVVV